MSPAMRGFKRTCPLGFGFDFKKKISGNKLKLPRMKRIPLKANGPMLSMPARCATKASPQMIEVSNKSASCPSTEEEMDFFITT